MYKNKLVGLKITFTMEEEGYQYMHEAPTKPKKTKLQKKEKKKKEKKRPLRQLFNYVR